MKHLKEGLIKHRGITQFYKEIQNPTYEDICQEGNIVFTEYGNDIIPCIVIDRSKVKNISKYIPGEKILIHYDPKRDTYNYFSTEGFKRTFPKSEFCGGEIIKVINAKINTEDIKTGKDILDALKKYNIE